MDLGSKHEDAAVEPSPPEAVRVQPRSVGRVVALDGLRGATVIIVFVSHLEVILPIPRVAVVPGGTVSLDSFFVLSGFLITALMLREQARTDRLNTPGFYRRRAIRLLPPLVAVLVGTVDLRLPVGRVLPRGMDVPAVGRLLLLELEARLQLERPRGQHRAGAPASVVARPRGAVLPDLAVGDDLLPEHPRTAQTVVIVLVTIIVAISVHRGASCTTGSSSWYADFIRTDTRADGILLGCLVAHVLDTWARTQAGGRAVRDRGCDLPR